MSETRKLTTIVAADVVGYSRLAAADEERTVARLRALRGDLIDPAISAHQGRIVKRTGDGTLMEFRSVVDAVRCAIEVQNGMVERNAGLPPERQILFRVGIHLGDVIEEADGDLMGDGVNIAARLESICEPGSICLSEDAYRQVRSRLDLAVTDLGNKELKNIHEPVHVFSLEVGKPSQAKPAAPTISVIAAPKPRKRSALLPLAAGIAVLVVIAAVGAWYFLIRPGANLATNAPAHLSIVVLPFQNLSGDPKQDYFADGITENLTTDLSRIRNSFVIARNTAFTYKGKAVDAKEIGKELGVRYVLEGSVARDGNRVRINAQLIDAESGAHLWADRFEEDLADLFKLQDDVVARLANSLGYELVRAEAAKGARSINPDAIDLSLQGWAILNSPERDQATTDQAGMLFARALKLDRNDDVALAGTATVEARHFAFGWGEARTDFDSRIISPADRAIALNPENAAAYAIKAIYLFLTNRGTESLQTADAGLAINPNSTQLYNARAGAERSLWRFDEAKTDILLALRLSPRDWDAGRWRALLGEIEIGLGHYDSAIEEEQRAIGAGYTNFIPYADLAAASELAGKHAAANAAVAEARRINPKLTVKWWTDHGPGIPILYEAIRKAGLLEDEPAPPPKHLSIVVLPFNNLSGDPKQDYLADVLTDELTTDLARIHGSFVIARNTAFTFKGKPTDAKAIGKDLGVRYVLEGSVQPTGNQVRVNAQLIDADSGAHLWADNFDSGRADLLQMQDEIVTRLGRALEIQLTDAEAARLKRAPAAHPDAEDLAMQCQSISQNAAWFGKEADVGYRLCEQALAIDPNDVRALGILSLKFWFPVLAGFSSDPKADIKRADELVSRAIAADPNYAGVHIVKAYVLMAQSRFNEAIVEAQTAHGLEPAVGNGALADAYSNIGRWNEAIDYYDKAIRISPHDPDLTWWYFGKGRAYFGLNQDGQAVEWNRRSMALNPTNPWAQSFLAAALALSGHEADARDTLQRYFTLPAAARLKTVAAIKATALSDDPRFLAMQARLLGGLRKAGMPEDQAPRLSIVVLPFQNLSGDAKQDYLADVLTDELTTYISRIPGSFVIARNTAFTYKAKPTDAKEIGKDLGVRYALEGSVQPTDKRIRTNAQLIDTETGAHLWAEEFDTDKTDLFETEDQIVTRLARSLDVALTEVEAAKGARVRPDRPDAQDLALRCSANVNGNLSVRDPAKLALIYAPCEQALHLDPRNVLALGLLGWRHAFAVTRGASADVLSDIRQADELISRALAVDPNDSRILGAKGLLLTVQGRLDEAISWYERSISANPSNVNAYSGLCGSYNGIGQPEKALQYADAVIRLSPRDPIRYLFYFHKMWALFALQRDSEALEWANRTLALAPGSSLTLRYAIAELTRAGRDGEAREAYQRLTALPGNPIKTIAQLKTYDARTWPATDPDSLAARERLYAGLRKAGMPEQ